MTGVPSRDDGAYERGARAMRQGDVRAAIPELERALELDPADARALSLYAQALLVAGDMEASGAALERLRALDPGAPGLEYFLGLASYRLGDWETTKAHLLESLTREPDRALTHLFLGIARQELGERSAAARSFDEAERLDPRLAGQVAYRRALLAVSGERYDEARGYFERVREQLPDSPLARSAASYLARLEARRPSAFEVFASAGGGYDSNVNLAPDDDPVAVSGEADGLALLELGGLYRHRAGAFELLLGQSFTTTFHGEEGDFDQEISRTWLRPSADLSEQLEVGLGYAFEQVWVEWNDFRRTHAVEPDLSFHHDRFLARGFFRYERRRFEPRLTPALDRDGEIQRGGGDVYLYLPDPFGWGVGWIRGGLHLRRENARGGDFDAFGLEPVAGLGVPLPARLLWRVEARHEWRDYDDPSTLDPLEGNRDDRIWQVWTALSRPLTDHLSAEARYRYTERGSNVGLFKYDRHEAQFLATYHY